MTTVDLTQLELVVKQTNDEILQYKIHDYMEELKEAEQEYQTVIKRFKRKAEKNKGKELFKVYNELADKVKRLSDITRQAIENITGIKGDSIVSKISKGNLDLNTKLVADGVSLLLQVYVQLQENNIIIPDELYFSTE